MVTVLAQTPIPTPATLEQLTALISTLCSPVQGGIICFDTILTVVASLISLVVNLLHINDLTPGTNCVQTIVNIILRLINAVLTLVNCLANVLLTTLQSASSNCCQVITGLANAIISLLVNVVKRVVALLSGLLSLVGVSTYQFRNILLKLHHCGCKYVYMNVCSTFAGRKCQYINGSWSSIERSAHGC